MVVVPLREKKKRKIEILIVRKKAQERQKGKKEEKNGLIEVISVREEEREDGNWFGDSWKESMIGKAPRECYA